MKAHLRFLFFPLLTIVLIVGAFLFAALRPAEAAPQCGPAKQVLEVLHSRFGEDILFIGTGRDNRSVVITARPDGTTWTALVDGSDGAYCAVASGADWDAPAASPPGELN